MGGSAFELKGSALNRCVCTEPVHDDNGLTVTRGGGKPKHRQLGTKCHHLRRADGGPTSTKQRGRYTSGRQLRGAMTVEEWPDRWLATLVNLRRSTFHSYEGRIRKYLSPDSFRLARAVATESGSHLDEALDETT